MWEIRNTVQDLQNSPVDDLKKSKSKETKITFDKSFDWNLPETPNVS